MDKVVSRDARCPATIITNASFFLSSPTGKQAFAGSLQFSLPTSYKFVATNPLGQPLLAFAGNNRKYSSINTITRQFISGGIDALGARNNIPLQILEGDWGEWLTGRIKERPGKFSLLQDLSTPGIWITSPVHRITKGIEYVLLDPATEHITKRVLTSETGREVAIISYGDYHPIPRSEDCAQPHEITISGLRFGTEMTIRLSETEYNEEPKTYTLSPPRHYFIKKIP